LRKAGLTLFCFLVVCGWGNLATADIIEFSGAIYQPPANTAVNNPSLNSVQLGDSYNVSLSFNGSITSPGAYSSFTAISFEDTTAAVGETSFDLTNISLTIATDAANPNYDDFSLLACLATGSACNQGDQLAAEFAVLAADLDSPNAAAQSIPFLTPLDLLEDDGSTDIQGTVTGYSCTGSCSVSTVAEPSSLSLQLLVLAGLLAGALRRRGPLSKGFCRD
jgi:hypothetical protein